jgi:hypothetical protein
MAAELPSFQLEVYKTLREEITHHVQAMSALLGVALTASAAIGAFGLSKTGNREALLVLPYILSGLALVQVNHGIQIRRLGEYIRTYLWPAPQPDPALTSPSEQLPPSWEEWIADRRLERRSWRSPTRLAPRLAQFAGIVVALGFPSAGALALTWSVAEESTLLMIVWWLGLVVMVGSLAFVLAVEADLVKGDKYRAANPRPRSSDDNRGSV